MSNAPLPVARAKVSIGGVTGAYTLAAVSADAYTVIGGIRTIGGFGDTRQAISVDEVSDGRTRFAKGPANAGTMELLCSLRRADAGQIAAVAAADSSEPFNIKVELPITATTFATYYLSALVMSNNLGLGGATDTQTVTYSLQITEKPIEVPV